MTEQVTNKKMFSVKDLVWFVALAISISSSFIITQVQTNRNTEDIRKLTVTLEQNNLELINYKLNQLSTKQDDFINSFNKFLDDYYKR